MTIEGAVRQLVLSASAVSALVATRVWMLKLPQTPTLPAIVTQLIGEAELYSHDGSADIFRARVQVDALSEESSGVDPYAQATAIAEAVNGALSGYRGDVGGSPAFTVTGIMRVDRRTGYDAEELRIVRVSQDYICWYRV